jgi:formamidase
VELLKGLAIDGPLLLPLEEDLPFLARPLSGEERERCEALAREWGVGGLEESAPISVIGTGPDLNSATDNGLERAAWLLDIEVPEVRNRATISGAIEIGRHPGVVQVTFRAPLERLEARGLVPYVRDQYGLG